MELIAGTYSLQAGSVDEEVARDFLLFGRPDVTVVVVDATRLERNLNLTLQVLEITERVVVCLNLMDEAKRRGIGLDVAALSRELGVPVVATAARRSEGIDALRQAILGVANGSLRPRPYRVPRYEPGVEECVVDVRRTIEAAFPGLPNARWVALRLLNADERVERAIVAGEMGALAGVAAPLPAPVSSAGVEPARSGAAAQILAAASAARWKLPADFHDRVTQGNYESAEQIAGRVQLAGIARARFDVDRLDRRGHHPRQQRSLLLKAGRPDQRRGHRHVA